MRGGGGAVICRICGLCPHQHHTWGKMQYMEKKPICSGRGHYPVCAQIFCKHWHCQVIQSKIPIHYEWFSTTTPPSQAQPPNQFIASRSCTYLTWMMLGIPIDCGQILRYIIIYKELQNTRWRLWFSFQILKDFYSYLNTYETSCLSNQVLVISTICFWHLSVAYK